MPTTPQYLKTKIMGEYKWYKKIAKIKKKDLNKQIRNFFLAWKIIK